MICKKCGAELNNDDVFCSKCGTKQDKVIKEEFDPLLALDFEENVGEDVIWQEAPSSSGKLSERKASENPVKQAVNNVAESIKNNEHVNSAEEEIVQSSRAIKSTIANPIKPRIRKQPIATNVTPKTEESPVTEQVIEEPVVAEPVVEKQTVTEPVVEEQVIEELAVTESVVEETSITTDATDMSMNDVVDDDEVADIFDDFIGDDSADIVDDSTIIVEKEEPVVQEPIVKKQAVEEPVVADSVVEKQIVEEPVIEESTIQEPTTTPQAEPEEIETFEDLTINDSKEMDKEVIASGSEQIDVEEMITSIKGKKEEPVVEKVDEINVEEDFISLEEEIKKEEPKSTFVSEAKEEVKSTFVSEDKGEPKSTFVSQDKEEVKSAVVSRERDVTPSIDTVRDDLDSTLDYDEEEDIKSKFNRNLPYDELDDLDLDVDEKVNSFTSKITTILIVVLILIIAIVVATFLLRNIPL